MKCTGRDGNSDLMWESSGIEHQNTRIQAINHIFLIGLKMSKIAPRWFTIHWAYVIGYRHKCGSQSYLSTLNLLNNKNLLRKCIQAQLHWSATLNVIV